MLQSWPRTGLNLALCMTTVGFALTLSRRRSPQLTMELQTNWGALKGRSAMRASSKPSNWNANCKVHNCNAKNARWLLKRAMKLDPNYGHTRQASNLQCPSGGAF